MRYTWNQPTCMRCWVKRKGDQPPVCVIEPYRETEQCAWCGETHRTGIYVRADPATVPYPQPEEDE